MYASIHPARTSTERMQKGCKKENHLRGIFLSSFMNFSLTLEKASSSSPPAPPGPNTLVALEPAAAAAEEEAVVGSGAASASLRLSLMA